MRERRNEMMLGSLLLLFAVVLWYRMSGGAEEQTFGPGSRGGASQLNLDAIQIYPVDWAVLTAARAEYDPSGRNIFQFGKPPKPKPPVLSDAEKAAIKKVQDDAKKNREEALKVAQVKRTPPPEFMGPPEAPVVPPPPKPKPPRVTYKFIGYFGPPDRKIAVLLDGKDEILGSRGDEFDELFRIMEIGYESIKFGFTDERFKDEYEIVPMTSGG